MLATYKESLPAGAIADTVNESLGCVPRLVVTAPPGAGKSTLLPLTLLESLPDGKILMLEPRRLAARQIASRMASMIGEKPGQTVGYRVRFESKVSAATRIEVLTEGILGRMLVDDPTLDGVAAVIFDEFHERSLASDMAFALTREAQRVVRPDLKMLIMSATIDAAELCRAFDAPFIESSGRMHPVETVNGDDIDPRECAEEVSRAVKRALRQRTGDILAFLPGQREIERCAALLDGLGPDTMVCTLYGLLPPDEQRRTLMPAPEGMRKVVLSTPIAETSLTIEGVTTVIDSGLCRTQVFDPATGLSRLTTVRVSLDMARQRSGRAGRLGPGTAYRLWSKATELRMAECRTPEIVDADLAPLVLDIAAWGESDPSRLPWITPPPAAGLAQARRLLAMLGAVDTRGAITPHGRRLAALPCHPRIAQMLVRAATPRLKALAADIAALLEEKDPLGDSGNDADINTRIAALREQRTRRQGGRWARITGIAAQYRRLVDAPEENGPIDPADTGTLIASAYPERIAMIADENGATVRYRLASGDFTTLDNADDLSKHRLLAVASLGNRIFLASPVDEENIAEQAQWVDNVSWDSRAGRAVARRELHIGALTIATRPIDISADIRRDIVTAICDAAPKEGLTMFDFSADATRRMQLRIAAVAEWHPELGLPDVSADALLARAADWLPLYIGRAATVAELRKIDIAAVIRGLLTYEQQAAVDATAPTHLKLPCGRTVSIDYRAGSEAPVVSARLQDCFGLTATPRVDGGRRPVLMELLSPGFKPVQLTQDLEGFWRNTYFEVRKELRRRYPKHRWPDNPLDLPAS